MKKLKSSHSSTQKRTAEIIRAALECFTESGFNNTSISDICIRANASTGSVYHHFKNKELLATAVYLEGIEEYQSGMLKIINEEDEALKGISSVIDYHLKWIRDNPDWAQFLFRKRNLSFITESEEKLFILNKKFIQGLMNWFKPHMEAGTVRTLAWDVLISLLLGPCQEYTKLYLAKKTTTKIEDACEDISHAVWCSLSQ